MSFYVDYIGTPDKIKDKLAEHAETLTGQSKEEFEAARPAINTILDQNVNNGVVRLTANGHATIDTTTGVKTYGQCTVDLKPLGGTLV